jgi:orotidine-5'-phosphate decarboxylase
LNEYRQGPRIVIALDYPDPDQALAFARSLDPRHCRLKVGLELYTAAGPPVVRALVAQGFDVFLDLKYHDIPNTVAQACAQAAQLGVWMLNVHALGGAAMMKAAQQAIGAVTRPPILIGVTILTSHADEDLEGIGLGAGAEGHVLRLAALARGAGLQGVVCSPREVTPLRAQFGDDLVLVTPGIRPASADADDQRRTLTPREALVLGSDFLVIGRPITRAPDPKAALRAVRQEIGEA